jgi:phage shock protein B
VGLVDHWSIVAALFSFLKLVTIFAFVLAAMFISKMGKHSSRRHHWRSREPAGEDQAILDDIARVAERMEQRIDSLEKILEADDPKWKERAR